MTTETTTPIEGEVIESALAPLVRSELTITTAPDAILRDAHLAAKALTDVIKGKPRPVKFNGEVYLEYEDWATVGRFYNVTAMVTDVQPVEVGGARGFRATAQAIRDGVAISSAIAMCLNDERNWKDKPAFQLMSMAQTRACAKALRNVLAWVVVLAGYRPTPAEEMVTHEERIPNATAQQVDTFRQRLGMPKNEVDALTQAIIVDAGKRAGGRGREATANFLLEHNYLDWQDFLQYGADDAAALIALLDPPGPVIDSKHPELAGKR